jgi:transposase
MGYMRGPSRNEVQLLPPCLDDFVPADAPVRFIDAFMDHLDLEKLGFTRAVPPELGRPAYHPGDLLKLYLYGYLYRIRSSRRLEAESARNLEVMWLLRSLRPDFKTIADFRKDNSAAFKAVFKKFNLLCRAEGLFAAELVAIDGSKFSAVNNSRRTFSQEQLQQLIERVEQRIQEYLSVLESKDREAEGTTTTCKAADLNEKIARLKQDKSGYEELVRQMEQQGQAQVSLTDPDARRLKGPRHYVVGYNVQVAVDSKHHLIVAEDVVQDGSDQQQLARMAGAAKEELGAEKLKVIADKGYHRADDLAACEQANIEPVVPAPESTGGKTNRGEAVFAKKQFRYDPQADLYHCPGGQTLSPYRKRNSRGLQGTLYQNRAACRQCVLKARCTQAPFRAITRWANEEATERCAERVAQQRELVSRRKEIVEHVFGTLRTWGHDRFLMRGLKKVRGEFSLSALAYNLRRVLNLIGCQGLMQKLPKFHSPAVGAAL